MFVAVSRFTIANGMADAVRAAFRDRPHLVDARMDPADAAVVTGALRAARAQFLDGGDPTEAHPVPPASWPEASALQTALLAGDQRTALAVMNRCIDASDSLVEVELHVVQPAFYDIGERWQSNQVTVAQEHMATAITQSVMTAGLLRAEPPPPNGRRVLLTCVEGNHHAVGARMVADAFQLASWEVQYLGANVPAPAIIRQIAEWRPHLVGLSVSFAQQLRVVNDIVTQAQARFGSDRPAIILGVLAINPLPELARLVGADAWSSDAPAAVACAEQLVDA